MHDQSAEIELDLDGIAQGGEAVGRHHGMVIFVGGGIPGERVRVRVVEQRAGFGRAHIRELLRTSPDRIAELDPTATHAGWQHIAHAAQQRLRRSIVAEQLVKFCGIDPAIVEPTIATATPWHYRNTLRVHVAGRQVGYYRPGSRAIQPRTTDPLAQPLLNVALARFAAALADGPPIPAGDMTLRLSETQQYIVAAWHGTNAARPVLARWRGATPALAGIAMDMDADDAAIGATDVIERIDPVVWALHPMTFTQPNLGAARRLFELIHAGLQLRGGEHVLDLYCGAGTFTLPLASHGVHVTGIEEQPQAVRDAQRSARYSGLGGATFVAGRAEDYTATLPRQFDAVVLDPPRRGCHPRVLAALGRLAARRVAYVSCHPGTLARDCRQLIDVGYRLCRVTPVDSFPQTPHVEAVAILERG